MCGIFGSNSFKTFTEAFVLNQERGTFSSGTLFIGDDGTYLRKNDNTYDIMGQVEWDDVSDFNMYLGHVQAPTGEFREWSAHTTHPFEYGDWSIAHNGVLENHHEIIEHHFPEHNNPVDSSVIARLLDEMFLGDAIFCISETLSKLRGTFACWLHNMKSNQTFLVRSGSTLYCDRLSNTFSSMPIDSVCEESVDQGVIYELTSEGMTAVGEFNYDNPFLIL